MGVNMKRIFVFLMLFVPIAVIADTMCVRDSSLVISLDSSNASGVFGFDPNNSVSWADLPYGRLYVEGTCLSVEEGLGQTAAGEFYGIGKYEKKIIVAEKGMSGTDVNGNERVYCWCRLTHPASSAWVMFQSYDSWAKCKSSCISGDYYSCGSMLRYGAILKSGMFRSIGLMDK